MAKQKSLKFSAKKLIEDKITSLGVQDYLESLLMDNKIEFRKSKWLD